jgi:DNA polymerase-3 subunit delta
MKVYANQLRSVLSKKLPLACWLSGDEPLQMRDSTDLIRSICKSQGFTERERYDVDANFEWDTLIAAGNSLSLFADKKLIELNLKSSKLEESARKVLAEYLQHASPDNLLLLSSPKIDAATTKTQWFGKLESQLMLVQIYPLEADKLLGWIENRLSDFAITADNDAIQLMADRIEGNMLAADQEIIKLNLLFGSGIHLRIEHIARTVADNARFNVFGLVDACLGGESARAVRTLQRMQQEGQELLPLNAMICKELRQLSTMLREIADGARIEDILQQHRIWNNRQPLLKRALRRLSLEQVNALIVEARDVDLAIKGMHTVPAWMLMEHVCLGLSGIKLPGRI